MIALSSLTKAEEGDVKRYTWQPEAYYTQHTIPKSNGGVRWLNEPNEWLKDVQYELLYNLLYKFSTHESAYGFRKNVSLIDGATKHVKNNLLLNVDLKNFFPTINKPKVISWLHGSLKNLVERKLITDFDGEDVLLLSDLLSYKNQLPQGAPTSPALSNLIFKPIDVELSVLAGDNALEYTRYADDLSFSHKDLNFDMDNIVSKVADIVNSSGFTLNPKKTRIMRPHRRMEVTGVVVNEKPAIARWKWRNLKAEIHNTLKKNEPISRSKFRRIHGKLNWYMQVKGLDTYPKWAPIDELKLLVN